MPKLDTAKVDAFLKEKYATPDKEVVQKLKTSNSLRNMALGMQADNLHDQIGSIVRSNPIHAYNHLTTDAASEAMDVEEAVERYSYNPMKEVETEMPESVVVADKVEIRGDILRNKIKAEYGATDASEGYGVRAGKAATSLVEQLPKAEDGRYIIDGYEYTHPEAVSVMQQVVENTMHPDLWKTDASYRDHYSWLNHGKSYKGILDEQYTSLSSKLDTLQSKIADRIKKQAAEIGVLSKDPSMALIGISEGEGMNKLRKVNDLLTSIKKDNFWSGLDEGFDSIDAVTLGLSSFLSEVQMTKVLDKVYNGEPLTERDQIYYDLWEVEQELKDIRSVKGQSWWNTVGSSVGTSAEMAPSFFVGMGSVGNIFKMSSLPLKAGMQLVKNSAMKGAWEGIKKGVGATMKVAGRSLGNVAKAEAMGMIAAPFLPSTWSEVASKRGDQYSLENGKLVYKPKAMWKDIANAWIEQGNELASEFIGTRIGDILGAGASTFGRMLGLDRVANKIGISSQATKLLGYEKPQWLKVLQRNLGYTGPVAEPLSEVWGDVASNLMKEGLTGDGEFSQFKSKDYWTTALAVSTIYGGSVAMATAPLAIYDYKNSPLQGMRKQRDGYLGMIKDKVLRNNLLSISSMGDLEQMSSALAHLDWGNMNKVDIAYGMDFIRADMAYKVMIGDAKESVRQEQYQNVVNDAYAVAYKGATGNTPTGYIVRVEAEDGSLYYVLRGSLDSASEDLLTCLNEEGNVVPLHPSKIKAQSTASLEDFMADGYTQLFATQVEMERQRDIIRDYKALENPTAEDIARIMSAFGATQQNAGDTVTLVDGGTGVVQEFDAETGKYLVNVVSNDGNTVMLDVPFYDILSNDAQMASAQSSRFAEQTLDDIDISLAQEESAEEMQEAEAVGDLKVGDIITTPNGTQGRVMGFNEGNVVVDENVENTTGSMRDAYIEEYSLNDIIKDTPSTEATTEVVAPQEAMEAPQPVEDIKIVPMQEDGSVDYDAITDASQFAELYTKEIGSREEATNEVIAMRDALTAQIAENAKKTQKATTPNERVKMRKAANALAERVAFYNKVLEMLAPQEVTETPVEPIVEDAAAVEVDTPREVDIIENEYSERLLDAEKKVYNAMAEALGLTVEFVKEVVEADGTRANAKIDGNKVIVGWMERDKAISFLIGHEFLHRMRDLAPETYEMFKDSVQTYKGEERWYKDLARMQARYRAQNKTISKELLEEEVIADFTGELVEKKDVFSSYIEANKENKTLLDKIAEVFRAIRDFLRSKGVEDRKLEDVVSALNNLIAEATAEATGNSQREGVEMAISQPKFSLASLVGVHNLSLDKLRKAIKMGGLANPSVAVIDVDKQTHDDYGEYSLVLPKNMVDARQGKNAGTWAGDAWTPTYPQIIKRIKDEKYYSRFHTDIEALPEAMRNKVRLEFDSFMEGRSADPLAYWYLFEKGSTPELVLVPSRYSDDITNAVSEATKGSFSMYGLSPDERAKCVDAYIVAKFNGDRAAFEQEMQERINRLTEALETKKSDRVKKWAQDTIDAIKEYGFDYNAVADFIRDVGYDAREKGTVNDSATTMAAREQIKANNLEADYEAWLNSLEERYGIDEYIFDGYTNSGNRRYLPHTLENVSKWMKKQGRQGAVATFPSFGVFIATAIPKMTSLESIRKRKALLGKSKEEYDAFREKWKNVYFELGKRLQPDAKGFDDYGYWRLIEAVGKSNPKEFIKKKYGIEMSEEDMAMFNDMVNAIRTEYPARYFETKFERPLQLSDFTAAVVPNDIPLDVESRLKDAGVEVIEYEKGDNASRAEAMQKASQMENVRFSLMDDAQAAAEVAPYLEAYNNDLVTFNALVNKVKDVAEKYPNATWPERFIKENYEDENEEDFINRLKWTISNYAVEEEKDYSAEKQTIEEIFGGIWIEDRAEFAKFAKAVNNTPFEENGEGIAYTDNYFYAYYRSIDGQPIPFASVYMNKDDSQDIVNTILKAKRNGEKTGIRRYFDRAYERARHISGKNDGDLGTNKELSNPRRNDRMDSELSRYGAYYDSPELFVKSTRAYKGSRIKYSLRTGFYGRVDYITDIAYEYGITQPIFVAETTEEYVKMFKDMGVKNPEKFRATNGAYKKTNDTIYLDAEKLSRRSEIFRTLLHERTHAITSRLNNQLANLVSKINKDDILAYRDELLSDVYKNIAPDSVIDEIISYIAGKITRDYARRLFSGELSIEDIITNIAPIIENTGDKRFDDIHHAILPLLKENLLIQKELYNGQKENPIVIPRESVGGDEKRDAQSTDDNDISRDGGRNHSDRGAYRGAKGEVTPRFALRDGGITLGDNKDIESINVGDEGVGSTTEEQVRTYLKHKHYAEVDNIRKKYKRLRDIARTDYKERMKVRMDRIGTLRTNAAKIEYILGENEELALPLEHQALVRIARGEIRIKWENSADGRKRGLAAEVGLKDGEKRLYASLTKDATLYFDEAVHQWWQMIGGYEREVDTQDLRNALIEALSEAHSPSMAITLLRNIYNAEEVVYDETMALYEHEEAKEIAEEQSRYDEDIAEFEANKDAMIREYEERASFFDAISAMEGTILDLRKRIDQIKEKASRRVSNIQAQYREMRELIARTKAAVKEVITSDNIRSFQSSELRRLINKVDKARSIYEVDNILVEVQSIMLDVSIRTQRMDMDRMLKLRLPNGEAVEAWVDQQMAEGKLSAKEGRDILDNMWKGKNASGVSVAKRIDGTTANTMAILRALISPTAHSKMVEDAEAAERGAMVRVDGELSLSQSNIEQNEARLQELEEKKATATAEGTEAYTSADAEEYAARTIYDSYLRAVMHKQDIQAILEAIQDVKEMYYGNPEKEAVRDHHIESLRDEMVEVKKKYLEALQTLNEEMLSLMREGRDALRTFRMAEQAHKEAIVKLGLDALGVSTRIVENATRTMPRVTAFLRSTLNASYYTFQTTLKEIDHLAPNGEGEFYNHFMFGMQQCSDNFYIQHTAHIAEVAQKMRVLLGKKGKKDATLIADVIEESDSKIIATITYGKGVNRGEIINPESYDLTISNAMYLIAMWRQPMYRNSMMAHGITQEAIDAIYDAVGKENKGYIPFMNWVNDTFLPDTRLLYDKVHKAMFGASMAKERNYFPARVIGYEEKQDISLNEVGMLPSTITGAIVQRVRNMRMPDIRMNYFKILMGHLQDLDQWSSYGPMIRDLNALCNNTLFREKCNKVMPGVNADGGGQGSLFQSFKTTAAIAVNCYRPKKAIADDIIMTVLRGWAGSNIAFRGWTAIKQLTSSPVFALYMLDGKCQELYLRNMGYGLTHMRKLHEWALENSPSYKQRWESKFAGMDVFTKKVGEENGFGVHHKWRATKAGKYAITFDNAMRKFAVDLGLTPNAAVDAFTVMTGIKTIYDYELQKEMERDGVNTPTEGMKKLAMLKAEIAFNSTQQSGENVYLSQLQKERTFATSVLTVYLNSSFGFHRLRVTGAQELWKQMTDAEYKKSIYEKYGDKAKEVLKDARKKATSQILQGVVGDLLFAVMSGGGTIGTFTMFGDGDDEGEIWEQTKKSLGVGVVNILTGGYMGGSILASALQGYKASMSTPFDELVNDIRWYASNDSLLAAFGHTINIISKYRYGLDFETLANTVVGVQGLIEGSGGNEAVMNILNVPQSQIAIIAGRRRPGETSSEYVTRIMHQESIIQAEDGSKRERELQKQYEMAYRKNVVVRTSGASVWQEMVTLEDDYKDITKELGWTANANPNEKAWETGMYVAPAEGISEAEYLALAQLEAEIAALEGYITHFEGTEDNYYNLVQRVTGVKKQFIEQYEQFK